MDEEGQVWRKKKRRKERRKGQGSDEAKESERDSGIERNEMKEWEGRMDMETLRGLFDPPLDSFFLPFSLPPRFPPSLAHSAGAPLSQQHKEKKKSAPL